MKIIPLSQPLIKLNIQLESMPYVISRSILVDENINMFQLHLVIQIIFEWQNSHLFEFRDTINKPSIKVSVPYEEEQMLFLGGAENENAFKITLKGFCASKPNLRSFFYEYDFGDSWIHKITIGKPAKTDIKLYKGAPKCVKALGVAPPEDLGGEFGYMNFCRVINDKKHPDSMMFREWLGMNKRELYHFDLDFLWKNETNIELEEFYNSQHWDVSWEEFKG